MTLSIATSAPDKGRRLTVVNDNWGATSLTAVLAVLESACAVLTDAFGTPPDAPVRVARWDRDPRALYDRRPYEIRLSARDRHWCQYVYQFSHELCHVMTHFDRYKEHRHNWFEESLCEMASLFVLHRLATVWVENPPPDILGASGFAPNHRAYAEKIEATHRAVPGGVLPEWFAANIGILEAAPCKRNLNGVVAVSLLDRFRDDPSLWRDCGWLNHWDPRADATFSDYLDSWSACLRTNGMENRMTTIVRELFLPDVAL